MPTAITCTRRIQFCAGHRVNKHESKCRNLHGHNYVAYFTARVTGNAKGDQLDPLGRVIDFGVLKARLGSWIDTWWDHGFILHKDDHDAQLAVGVIKDQKMFLMPTNPTAENIALYLLHEVCPMLLSTDGVIVTKVVVEETENCSATAELPDTHLTLEDIV